MSINLVILTFIWAFVVSVFAIPSIIHLAHKKNLLDIPNKRKVHASLTPRLGGLAIFAGFMSSITVFLPLSPHMGIQQLLAGTVLLFFIGLKDDIAPVSAFKKFFVQLLASGIVMFMGGIRISSFYGFMGVYELEIGVSYGFTLLMIIGITNAVNLIDGLDGLAGSIISIISVSFGIYFFIHGSYYALVAFGLFGSVMGFLKYNLFKASIFMGDTGSLISGFIVSVLAIEFIEMRSVYNAPIIAVSILIIPLFDTIRVFTIRILSGKSPFAPDKNHIHHRLLAMGLSQGKTLVALCAINLLYIFLINVLSYSGVNELMFIIIGISVAISVWLEYVKNKKVSNA